MAHLGFSVNTEDLPDGKDFSLLPPDGYTVTIVAADMRPTKDTIQAMQAAGIETYEEFRKTNPKASAFAALEMDVFDGKFAGRKLFHNLNLINDSEQARNISAGHLKQILDAFKMKNFSGDFDELLNKRFIAHIAIEDGNLKDKSNPESGRYPPKKNIKKIKSASAAAQQAETTTQAAAGTPKGPWGK